MSICPGFFKTVLYFRDVSWIQICPGFVLDLIFSDLSLENMRDVLVIHLHLHVYFTLCIRYILELWGHKIKFVKIIAGCGGDSYKLDPRTSLIIINNNTTTTYKAP